MKREPHPLADEILGMRGKKSFGLIAKELGVTRNVVAGVCFRHDYPCEVRVRAGHKGRGGGNKIGTGRKGGPRRYAKRTLPGAYPNTSTL